jgi:alpha-ketoglutarate-dependent taurine dioxygenase
MSLFRRLYSLFSKELNVTTLTHRLEKDGWVVINQYSEELLDLIENVCSKLELNISFHNHKELIPKDSNEVGHFSLSSSYGLNKFPLHTDGAECATPPRFLVLRALSNSPTRTCLADAQTIRNKLTKFNTLWRVKTKDGIIRTKLYELNPIYDIEFIRFNRLSMKCDEGNKFEVYNAIDNLLISHIKWTKNKTIIIDNWRVLHGREMVIEENYNKRVIERLQVFT